MSTKKLPVYDSKEYGNIREMLQDIAKRYPDRYAFSYRRHPSDLSAVRVSFPDFCADVQALGTELIARGVSGTKVAVIGKLSYPWVCTFFSLLAIGAVVVPLDREWQAEELSKTARHADCAFLFCDASLSEKADAVSAALGIPFYFALTAPETDSHETVESLTEQGRDKVRNGDNAYLSNRLKPLEPSFLIFTSGTTGNGKGVLLSQNGLMADLYAGLRQVHLSRKTVAVLPPHHTYGCNVGLVAHVAAGCEVYLSDGLRYIQRELRTEQPEHLTLVPLFVETFYRRILSTARDQGKEKLLRRMMKMSNAMRKIGIDARRSIFQSVLASFGGKLRLIVSGGAPISREILDTFDAIGITVINGYGITECSPLISATHQAAPVHGSVGKPLACNKIRLRDPNADGEGEICVRGANVMLGYYKDDAATEAAFDEDGYFCTGDFGKFDADGNLYITGRLKNLIILSNGKNVYPEEIEKDFLSIPGVLEVVVYEGKSRRGVEHNAIVAEIFPNREYLEKNAITDPRAYFTRVVEDYNKTALPYKKISQLRLRDEEFPKNTLRKILRFRINMQID
ncbi:MAG: long-chain fatty acid--CoA ligase [Ruminococcaceae bacterium]|nr:long-chain fatty acid--CoA ligase [Oscillospiraceae bacterium]